MNVKLNLEALNIFVQIVEKKSISAAAQSLNLPVSAVSRSLSKLESDLETTLLLR
ncbi:LysR family transcriptional regulator [Gallibacterium genomosp. 1]|uniref:LysR family transcriptional regulator n=1 Tax=Gallibacterium genomosp. 1 TaxID=155515 RepID=UPI000A7D4384|nr:LysR family transcriptional regulator [Gallibacterium genomosp. 1]